MFGENSQGLTKFNNRLLKTLDTIDNCQRQVFSLGVSQHMHKNNKPVKT